MYTQSPMHVHTCACTHVHTHMCTTHMHTHVHTHTHTHTRAHTCTHTCTHTRAHTHVHTHTCTHMWLKAPVKNPLLQVLTKLAKLFHSYNYSTIRNHCKSTSVLIHDAGQTKSEIEFQRTHPVRTEHALLEYYMCSNNCTAVACVLHCTHLSS